MPWDPDTTEHLQREAEHDDREAERLADRLREQGRPPARITYYPGVGAGAINDEARGRERADEDVVVDRSRPVRQADGPTGDDDERAEAREQARLEDRLEREARAIERRGWS
jgi:hypothetical protein